MDDLDNTAVAVRFALDLAERGSDYDGSSDDEDTNGTTACTSLSQCTVALTCVPCFCRWKGDVGRSLGSSWWRQHRTLVQLRVSWLPFSPRVDSQPDGWVFP